MSQKLVFRCHSCGGINQVPADKLKLGPKCGRCKKPLDLSSTPADISDDALSRLIASAPVPILVDFWAPWCGPCKMVAPHLKALAKKHAGKLIVVKVNTDKHQKTAGKLNIRSIPTLGVWSGGKQKVLQPGALTGSALESFVSRYL